MSQNGIDLLLLKWFDIAMQTWLTTNLIPEMGWSTPHNKMKIQTHLLAGIAAFAMCLATAQADIVIGLHDDPSLLPSLPAADYHGYSWSAGWQFTSTASWQAGDSWASAPANTPVTITNPYANGGLWNFDHAMVEVNSGVLTIIGLRNNVAFGTIQWDSDHNPTDGFTASGGIPQVDTLQFLFVGTGTWRMQDFTDTFEPPEDDTIPEPTTVLAGALLLLPFAASAVRSLRKARR